MTFQFDGQWYDRLYGEGSLVYLDARPIEPVKGSGLALREAFTFMGVLGEKARST